ncbi:MAG: phosphoribosyl-AMP cyclohydrolase [Blastomonas sp.]
MDTERETGSVLDPKYDGAGLLTAVITDGADGTVLMVGHMNPESLELTLTTGKVHFFSRSRQTLWLKGETSGNVLELVEARIDCDQDAVWISARPAGPTCHTGERSCFYRRIVDTERLERCE